MKDEYTFPYQQEEGSLYIPSSNRSGKKFQEWSFTPAKRDSRFTIQIDLMYPSNKNSTFRFRAASQHLSQSFESSDIEELRKMVNNDLQQRAYLFNEIEWEEWYEVKVSGSNDSTRGTKSTLEIKYGKIKRGVAKDGSIKYLHNNNVILPFPESKKLGTVSEDFLITTDCEISFVPATKKNKEALDMIIDKLGMLRTELASFLTQDRIQETIDINLQHKLISHS